jgi:hypothetical protein
MRFVQSYFDNSLEIKSPEFKRLADAARALKIWLSFGFSERDGGSLYIAQALIDDQGLGVTTRRKLKPTHVERSVWGEGDGSDLFVFRAGEAGGDSIVDFTAATANQVGDKLEFHGYGSGVQAVIAADSISLAYAGGTDIITLNTAGLHLSDILFA